MITFVAPSLDGPPTGGTRYNRELLRALAERGEPCEALSWPEACTAVREPRPRTAWVDSLWLERLPELAERASPQCRVGLLTHYLPCLVTHGERPPPSCVSPAERAALEAAEGLLAPSEYLATELVALGVDPERVRVVPPGVELPVVPRPPRRSAPGEPLRAVVIAHVVEGKGILPLLEGLASRLGAHDHGALELRVLGDLHLDPAHAEACTSLVARTPSLRPCVQLLGSRSHAACIEALLDADVLLSASRMESYGMALAEARACGRPILARPGGNVAALVDPAWGGALVPHAAAVAESCVALARDRVELEARQRRAWEHRTAWSWSASAARLVALLAPRPALQTSSAAPAWPPPRPPQ